MNRAIVKSSMFKSVGHEGDVLEVEMKNGKIYQHFGVSPEAHQDFINAESMGQHYNTKIKGSGQPWVRVPNETDGGEQPF